MIARRSGMFIPDPGEVRIWQLSLDRPPDAAERLLSLLSTAEQARAGRFVRPEDRRRFIMARVALRRVLGHALDLAPAAVPIAYGPFGKPHLSTLAHSLAFNLSHAGPTALIAVTNGPAVGVDIERICRDVDFAGIAAHFFAREEREQLEALPPANRREAFYRLWTAKEAFAKGLGDGLSLPLSAFAVRLAPDGMALTWPGNPAGAARWRVIGLEAGPGYAAALATEFPLTPIQAVLIDDD